MGVPKTTSIYFPRLIHEPVREHKQLAILSTTHFLNVNIITGTFSCARPSHKRRTHFVSWRAVFCIIHARMRASIAGWHAGSDNQTKRHWRRSPMTLPEPYDPQHGTLWLLRGLFVRRRYAILMWELAGHRWELVG